MSLTFIRVEIKSDSEALLQMIAQSYAGVIDRKDLTDDLNNGEPEVSIGRDTMEDENAPFMLRLDFYLIGQGTEVHYKDLVLQSVSELDTSNLISIDCSMNDNSTQNEKFTAQPDVMTNFYLWTK